MRLATLKTTLIAALALALILPTTVLAIGDVGGVTAVAGDSEVALSWNPVADAEFYRIYNGTESVGDNEMYDLPSIDTLDNETSIVVTGLTNGVTYYYSVTAVDSEGNESEFYSDPEVSATPQEGAGSTQEGSEEVNLEVTKVEATDNETLQLTFSEPVLLPANAETLFPIVYNFNETPLTVTKAELSNDETKVTVTTFPQEPGGEYTLTLPETLVSKSGNEFAENGRLVIFLGSSKAKGSTTDPQIVIPTVSAEEGELKLVSATSTSPTEIVVMFNKPVILPATGGPVDPFSIVNNQDPDKLLTLENYTLDAEDPMKVILTTAAQDDVPYTIVAANITDTEGNVIAGNNSTIQLGGSASDQTPPEDATNLKAKLQDVTAMIVNLNWTKSLDTAGDLVEYALYKSSDDGQTFQFVKTITGSADANSTVEGLQAETTYTFKLTAKDDSGNESEGVETKITLPETGPGLLGLALGSLFGGKYLARRKRRR